MANIFARSPYLIRVAEAGQNGSKVELFIKTQVHLQRYHNTR
jgi:hypothetical protein